MAATTGPLNNQHLVESFLSAKAYNSLPLIKDAKLEPLPAQRRQAQAALLDLISANNLHDRFSIHLVHKHFDCPEGHVMVYENVEGGEKTSGFTIMTPRDPVNMEASGKKLRGLYFMATPEGKMAAYEYTTKEAQDLSAYEDFVAEFAKIANQWDVAHIFCLGAEGISSVVDPGAEFEMPMYSSTVVVRANTLEGIDELPYTATDWFPTSEASAGLTGAEKGPKVPEVPGVLSLKCIEDRVGNHNYHGESVETRQSMPGMSHKIGTNDVSEQPRVQIPLGNGLAPAGESVIREVMNLAQKAILEGNAIQAQPQPVAAAA